MTTQEKIKFLESVIKTSDDVLTTVLTALSGMRTETEYVGHHWDVIKVINRTEALETVIGLGLERTQDALYGEGSGQPIDNAV